MATKGKRASVAAYDVFHDASAEDVAALGLIVVETNALGGCPVWGRYRTAPAQTMANRPSPRVRRAKAVADHEAGQS